MENYVDPEQLFKARLDEEDIQIPGVGTVRVRALNRAEVLMVRKATDDEHVDGPRLLTLERKMIATAMVKPMLSESQVGKWQQASAAGELTKVTDVIQRLSGMLPETAKEVYQEFEADPEAEFRDGAGGEAPHDGSPAAG